MRMLLSSVAAIAAVGLLGTASGASASSFTTTSPTGGPLPSGVTPVGGVVLDLTGLNGNQVVSQLAADQLYVGYAPTDVNGNSESTFSFGTQNGFSASDIAALGGGLAAASVRVSLYDGDSGINDGGYASGAGGNDFDAYQDTLALNGVTFGANGGNFSNVITDNTDSMGGDAASGLAGFGTGFRNNLLDTGFFTGSGTQLAQLYSTLSSGKVAYSLTDLTPGDNYFDFTQGVDGSFTGVGTPPVITPPVSAAPEPSTWALMMGGIGFLGFVLRRTSVAPALRFTGSLAG